jgi:integrase/recombinase XerC
MSDLLSVVSRQVVLTDWMSAFEGWLRESGRRENSVEAYMQDVKHFGRFFERVNKQAFEPGLLNASDVKAYFAEMDADKSVAPTSRNRRLASLRVLVEWAVAAGLLEYDPTVAVRRVAVELTPRDRTGEELTRLEAVVEAGAHIRCEGERHGWLAWRDRVLYEIFIQTGLRIHEVAGLDVDDLDFDACTIRVLGKGGKKAVVTAPSALMDTLREWIEGRGGESAAVLVGWRGERMTTGQIRRRLQMMGEAAGIHDLKPHDLRHSYAYRLAQAMTRQGLSPEKALDGVRRQLRHGDSKTTLLYFRVRGSEVRAAVESLCDQ